MIRVRFIDGSVVEYVGGTHVVQPAMVEIMGPDGIIASLDPADVESTWGPGVAESLIP